MMFLWGGVSWGIYTLALGLMGERFAATELAAANAAFVMMYEVGSVGGPMRQAAPWINGRLYGLPIVVAVAAGALLVFGLLAQSRPLAWRRTAPGCAGRCRGPRGRRRRT